MFKKHCEGLNINKPKFVKFPFKVIVIDEIDGTSPEFKDAFKGFIEKYQFIDMNHFKWLNESAIFLFILSDCYEDFRLEELGLFHKT